MAGHIAYILLKQEGPQTSRSSGHNQHFPPPNSLITNCLPLFYGLRLHLLTDRSIIQCSILIRTYVARIIATANSHTCGMPISGSERENGPQHHRVHLFLSRQIAAYLSPIRLLIMSRNDNFRARTDLGVALKAVFPVLVSRRLTCRRSHLLPHFDHQAPRS